MTERCQKKTKRQKKIERHKDTKTEQLRDKKTERPKNRKKERQKYRRWARRGSGVGHHNFCSVFF